MKQVGISKVAILGGRGIVEGVVWDGENGRYQDFSGVIDVEKLVEGQLVRLLRSKRGTASQAGGGIKLKVFKVKGGAK